MGRPTVLARGIGLLELRGSGWMGGTSVQFIIARIGVMQPIQHRTTGPVDIMSVEPVVNALVIEQQRGRVKADSLSQAKPETTTTHEDPASLPADHAMLAPI